MAYTAINDPEAYFQTKLYTGDGSTPSITLDGDTDMQPDLVWIKNRDEADSHCLFDSVRGATEVLHSDNYIAEVTDADTLTSFDSDGFALGADVKVNTDTEAYVAWNWKAGTAFSNDASATSIGDIDSSGSTSTTAGFSIVQWVGTGSNAGIKHGLSTKPSMIITKPTGAIGSFYTYHKSPDATDFLKLNDTDAAADNATIWNDTEPTTSIFTTGTAFDSGRTFIAYCFSEISGYSKFGSYTGNGDADGTFVYTGFRPAWVMVKRTDSVDYWYMFDNKRDVDNVMEMKLEANTSDAEYTSVDWLDFTSNGFKWRYTGGGVNGSGSSFIYMAFAEAPFVNSNGVPCNAR